MRWGSCIGSNRSSDMVGISRDTRMVEIEYVEMVFAKTTLVFAKTTLVFAKTTNHHAEDSAHGCGTVSYVENTAHRRCDRCAIEKIGENGRRNS